MSARRAIEVWADWEAQVSPRKLGLLHATPARGKEVFSFEYESSWLESAAHAQLDPELRLHRGPQYPAHERANFGLFLDSSPDRWGRVLMRRREAWLARIEERPERRLVESDYLLGVHDGHRMGALRFKTDGDFLDDNDELASPPWTSLRELEQASLQLEREDATEDAEYATWLRMLIAPGGSLGGARPKASVTDEHGALWIAKFPSRRDDEDIGAWEAVVHELAVRAGVQVPEARLQRFGSKQHTFLSRRFDRKENGQRVHFASAMTLLERADGDAADEGASYLELADFLTRFGAQTSADLEQLWRRIAFSICVSNTDDHLRNHGFLLASDGWVLAPAYDMNPDPHGEGLKLNISETDNAQNLELLMNVAPHFRVKPAHAEQIIDEVRSAVGEWKTVAIAHDLSPAAQGRMARAFRHSNS